MNLIRIAATILPLLAIVAPAAAQTELVVAVYGGAYTEALQRSAAVADFEKANDAKITWVPASGADGLAKAMAGEVDVIHADLLWAARGELQNAFVKLDPNLIPNLAELHPKARFSEYGVATNFGDYGIVYNTEAVKTPPTSWLDLGNPEFQDQVNIATFDAANAELLILLAELNGGGIDKIDPGFTKAAELARNSGVLTRDNAQILDLLRNEDVVMTRWIRGRVAWAHSQGVSNVAFAAPKEGTLGLVSTVHVVAKRPHPELAMKFINALLSKENQRIYAEKLGYTPARTDVDLNGIDVPSGIEFINSLRLSDWNRVAPKMDEWGERWEKEVVAQ